MHCAVHDDGRDWGLFRGTFMPVLLSTIPISLHPKQSIYYLDHNQNSLFRVPLTENTYVCACVRKYSKEGERGSRALE